MREYATGLVEGSRNEPVIDLVESFSFPFPGFAAFSLLGFPESDTEQLKDWSRNRVLLTYGRLPEDQQVATAKDVLGDVEVRRGVRRRALGRPGGTT